MKRAFTLIEVMMAAGIIGIGVLGLFALLAGAAKVQQTSSQTSESVHVAKNAEALLRQSLAGIQFNPVMVGSAPTENQWYMVLKNQNEDFLEITNPVWSIAESTEPTPFTIFEREVPKDPSGVITGAGPIPASPGVLLAGSTEYALQEISQFSHRDILPDSLVFTVRTINTPVNTTPVPWEETGVNETLYFRPASSTQWPQGNLPPGSEPDWTGGDVVYFYADGDPSKGPTASILDVDYIAVNVKHFTQNGGRAFINSYRIAPVANLPGKMIDKITVDQSYRYINSNLLSLNDRVTYANDEKRADGRRPEFAFSVMYRTLSGGGSQAGVFMYGLQAPSRNAEWNPMETSAQYGDEQSPVVDIGQSGAVAGAIGGNVILGFDPEPSDGGAPQYYLQVDPDDAWVVAQGQVVLIGWANSVGSGADDAVRVVRTQDMRVEITGDTDTGQDFIRGYLERGPRAANQSMLNIGGGGAAQTEPVVVWVVKDVAMSDEDGTTWRLRPLRFQAFQLDG